jgi:hypothetical protein
MIGHILISLRVFTSLMQGKEVDMKNGKLKRLAQGKTRSVEKRFALPTHLLIRTVCATSPPKTTQ